MKPLGTKRNPTADPRLIPVYGGFRLATEGNFTVDDFQTSHKSALKKPPQYRPHRFADPIDIGEVAGRNDA
jgi:hypothetical protein